MLLRKLQTNTTEILEVEAFFHKYLSSKELISSQTYVESSIKC